MSAFWQFVKGDWYFAIPMGIMSIVALSLVIWRLLLNLNARTNMNEFLPLFQEKLEKEGLDGALRLCRVRTDVIPRRLYAAGLETSKQGLAAMRRAMANVIELEILPDLNFLLPTILAIAKIATMVGLLGTVISMIGTFQRIQESSGNATESQRGHRSGLVRHGDGPGHGHPAGVHARAVQGVGGAVRGQDEGGGPEAADPGAVRQTRGQAGTAAPGQAVVRH